MIKAISKQPEQRYRTAGEFADDLRNFLDHKPLIAKPASRFERANKWAARHPRMAVSVALILMSIALTTSAGLIWSRRVNRLLEISKAESVSALQRERNATREAMQAQGETESLLYAADVRLAADGLSRPNIGAARDRLARHIPRDGETDRRRFAWHYIWNELHPEEMVIETHSPVRDVCFSPDGSLIAAGDDSGHVTIWNAETGALVRELAVHRDIVRDLAFSHDGALLASASDDGTVALSKIADGSIVVAFAAHPEGVDVVLLCADRTVITAGGGVIKLWRNTWDKPLATMGPHPTAAYGMAISPDGRQLAVASGGNNGHWRGLITLWDLRDLSKAGELTHVDKFTSVAYSHDGSKLMAGTQYGGLVAWHLSDLSRPFAEGAEHTSNIYRLAFSTDDRLLASASKDLTVRIWDAATLQPLRVLQSHGGRVYAAHFSPTGERLVTGRQRPPSWGDGRCRTPPGH